MTRHISLSDISEFTSFEDDTHRYTTHGPERTASKKLGPLAEVLETLYSEHRYFSTLLDKLEEEADKLVPGKIPDFHLLLDIVDYLKHYPGKYHHPRENLLFSILQKRNQSFRVHKEMLEHDHDKLDQMNQVLFTLLTGIVKGDKVNRASLAKRLSDYIRRYRKHIEFESKEIFPMTTGKLSASDIQKLHRQTLYLNDPLFGGELEYKYHRLARNLSYEIEVNSSRLAVAELTFFEVLIKRLTTVTDASKTWTTSIYRQSRSAVQEQIQTCRDHTEDGLSAELLKLPIALGKNHKRHLWQGWVSTVDILKDPKSQHIATSHSDTTSA